MALTRKSLRPHAARLALFWAGLAMAPAQEGAPPSAARETLRLGFTFSMFTGVNENDARASIKALASAIGRERAIPADPDPVLFEGTDRLAAAFQTGEVDAVGMITEEYWAIARDTLVDRFLMAVRDGRPEEEYILLVRRDSGLSAVADLRGKRLGLCTNPRMSLGPVWLDVFLAHTGHPPVRSHFGRVTEQPKVSKAVLDVFFRQTDACLVTRHGFATMNELNPQVGSQLAILSASPPLVPSIFAFRGNMPAALKEKSLHEFPAVHTTPAGQQALTIFQVGQVAEFPASALEPSLALLDEFARLRPDLAANRRNILRRQSLSAIR